MKIAEIVPLYKGKEEDMVINYCPVSLLMTVSKVLEKKDVQKNVQFSDKEQYIH